MEEEPLSQSVRSLLEDDLFKTGGDDNAKDAEEEAYQQCMSLFIGNEVKRCLEMMLDSGLLVADVPVKVYDLALTAFSRVPNFQNLGVSLKNVARDMFTGEYSSLLGDEYYSHSPESSLEFLHNYFTCCVRTVPITHDPEFPVVVQDHLKQALVQQCGLLKDREESSAVCALPYLQKLVQIYIFDLEIRYMSSTKSPQLYTRLCQGVPNLSELLSKHADRTGATYEQLILSQLETVPKEKPKAEFKPQPSSGKSAEPSPDKSADPSHNEAKETTKDLTDLPQSIRRYLKDTLSHNPQIQRALDYITSAKQHPVAVVTVALVSLALLRRYRRHINYLLCNVLRVGQGLLPHIVALLRLLAAT